MNTSHKALIELKLNQRNSFQNFEPKKDNRLGNLKILADEMVKALIEKKRKEQEERLNDETIFYEIDLKYKHKSQILMTRNHHQMLKNFALNRNSEESIKLANDIIRRQNKQITGQKIINYSKNKISFYSSKNPQINRYNLYFNNEEENKTEEKKSKVDSKENKLDKNKEEFNKKITEDIELNSEDLIGYESDELSNENQSKEKFQVFYVNPTNIDTKEREELSTKNEIKNDDSYINAGKQNKGSYLFEKGMKMLKMKNNKIKKEKEIKENKNKGFFDIKHYLKKNENKSHKIKKNKFKEKNYIPLEYKAGELYKSHLAKIEIMHRNNIIREQKKDLEEMKPTIRNKRKLSEKSWNNFLKKENEYLNNKMSIKEESLNKINKNEIYDRPKINKSSIIMLEQKEEKNKSNNKKYKYSNIVNKYNNIYTKLYEDKEIYAKKLQFQINNSKPAFSPKIYENARQRTFRPLNSFIENKSKNNYITKTENNKNKRNNFPTRNKSAKILNLNYTKKVQKKNIQINVNNSFSPKLISSKTTNKLNRNIKYKNDINKKTYVFELNISNPNYNKKNSKSILNSINTYSFIQKLGENASKNFSLVKHGKMNKNLSENEISKKRNKRKSNTQIKLENKIEKIPSKSIDNEKRGKKNIRLVKKKIEINENTKSLYNLNLRDYTSNSLKQFVVLTSKEYIDFFK